MAVVQHTGQNDKNKTKNIGQENRTHITKKFSNTYPQL